MFGLAVEVAAIAFMAVIGLGAVVSVYEPDSWRAFGRSVGQFVAGTALLLGVPVLLLVAVLH